jgi:hypothetical protein
MSMASPRIATDDSFDTKPATFDHSVFEDGFFGILTTSGRIPTTIGQKW